MNDPEDRGESPSAGDNPSFADLWLSHHGFLLDVAYRLLGSYGDAEDMVQEGFIRLLRSDLDPIEDVRAWLVVVVSRLCLDQLRSARMRRESYVGAWLPEPLVQIDALAPDPAESVTLDESVHMALLIVLDKLSPAERVVFVLHEVFAFPFERIASIVKKTPEACRQLASRARRRIDQEGASGRFPVDPDEQRRVVAAFIAACQGASIEALLPLLDPSVVGWADAGGTLAAVRAPNVGRSTVAEAVIRFFGAESGARLDPCLVNGEPGIVVLRGGAVSAVLALTLKGGLISRVYAIADPRKLARVAASWQGRSDA
jgi:RNA polymerase sigma-70 factor (ECF subfamily)